MTKGTSLIYSPMLDWFGVWAGYSRFDEYGVVEPLDTPQGVRLAVQPARLSSPFLSREKPWESSLLNQLTILWHEGKYRMWYSAWPAPDTPGIPQDHVPGAESAEFVCYAESEDGWQWDRPDLGSREFGGSGDNNIVCDAGRFGFQSVFVDPRAPAGERYRAIDTNQSYFHQNEEVSKDEYQRRARRARDSGELELCEVFSQFQVRYRIRAACSGDGIHWRVQEAPILELEDMPDTQNVACYDAEIEKYVIYLRGRLGVRRSVKRTDAQSFQGPWSDPRFVLLTDPQDEPDVDLYTTAYCHYPTGGFHLQFPSLYHRADDSLDIHLATSRDGLNWSRPGRGPVIANECALGQDYGSMYAGPSLVSLGADEWGLPVNACRRLHNQWNSRTRKPFAADGEYCWAVWKRDRLVALEASVQGQCALVGRPCVGEYLVLNYETELGGWIRVELARDTAGPGGDPFPGFSFDESIPLHGDELDGIARWKEGADLSRLAGRSVIVRLRMFRARVYATAI